MLDDRNFIINSKANKYYWEGEGLYSIKSFTGGEAFYNVGNGSYRTSETSFLLLNHKQEYSITIDAKKEVQSFTLFFNSYLIKSIYNSLTEGLEKTLDNYRSAKNIEFFVRNYEYSSTFLKIFSQFKKYYEQNKHDKIWLDEKLNLVAEQVILENLINYKTIQNLNYLKASTRVELFKRVVIAKEYLYAHFDKELSLNKVSKVSCLSVNNLIRIFQQVYNKTPHQYLVHIRIKHSRHLLSTTDFPLSEIVFKSGFTSIPSFCSLFLKIVGLTPMQYRKLV